MWANAEGFTLPASWTDIRILQAEAASGKSRANGCVSRSCTKSATLKNGSAIPCAWAADAAAVKFDLVQGMDLSVPDDVCVRETALAGEELWRKDVVAFGKPGEELVRRFS